MIHTVSTQTPRALHTNTGTQCCSAHYLQFIIFVFPPVCLLESPSLLLLLHWCVLMSLIWRCVTVKEPKVKILCGSVSSSSLPVSVGPPCSCYFLSLASSPQQLSLLSQFFLALCLISMFLCSLCLYFTHYVWKLNIHLASSLLCVSHRSSLFLPLCVTLALCFLLTSVLHGFSVSLGLKPLSICLINLFIQRSDYQSFAERKSADVQSAAATSQLSSCSCVDQLFKTLFYSTVPFCTVNIWYFRLKDRGHSQ